MGTPRTVSKRVTALLVCALSGALAACGGDDDGLPPPAGEYVLDRATYARAVMGGDESAEARRRDVAARQQALERAQREAARVDIQLVLEADGSFVVRYRFDQEQGRYRGVWRRRADRLTLMTTHTPSGPLESPETVEVRYSRDSIEFEAGIVPRPFVLRRR